MTITVRGVRLSLGRALLVGMVAIAVGFRLSDSSTPLAQATMLTVDRLDDSAAASTCSASAPNDCSLRGAILAANAVSGGTTIQVPAGTWTFSRSHRRAPFRIAAARASQRSHKYRCASPRT